MKSKTQRDKKAALLKKEAARLEREIREYGTPSNPKQATAKWGLVVELSRLRGESVNATKKWLWPKEG